MQKVFVRREAWVLSGSMVSCGETVVAECDAVIFLTIDPAERLRRLQRREMRCRAGGAYDHAAWQQFLDWARGYDDPAFAGRSRAGHETWLAEVGKPVLRLDSSAPTEHLLETVLNWDCS